MRGILGPGCGASARSVSGGRVRCVARRCERAQCRGGAAGEMERVKWGDCIIGQKRPTSPQ
jgi:hypothetical protein